MPHLITRPRSYLRTTTRRLQSVLGCAVIAGAAVLAHGWGTSCRTSCGGVRSAADGTALGACEVEFDLTGRLWVEQYLAGQFARMDPATGRFTEFNTPMPLSVPGGEEVGQTGRSGPPRSRATACSGSTPTPVPCGNSRFPGRTPSV